jgi:hypothetical protein
MQACPERATPQKMAGGIGILLDKTAPKFFLIILGDFVIFWDV